MTECSGIVKNWSLLSKSLRWVLQFNVISRREKQQFLIFEKLETDFCLVDEANNRAIIKIVDFFVSVKLILLPQCWKTQLFFPSLCAWKFLAELWIIPLLTNESSWSPSGIICAQTSSMSASWTVFKAVCAGRQGTNPVRQGYPCGQR